MYNERTTFSGMKVLRTVIVSAGTNNDIFSGSITGNTIPVSSSSFFSISFNFPTKIDGIRAGLIRSENPTETERKKTFCGTMTVIWHL